MTGQKPNGGHYSLRCGITIYPAQDQAINQHLSSLLQKTPAKFCLLCDVTGQVISAKGNHTNLDLVALGSLIAGDLAASQEIARLTNEYQDYQMVLREGQQTHTFICEAGHYLALLVQVSNDIPLGWARMIITQSARQLAQIMAETPPEARNMPAQVDPLFDQETDLPELFSEALDDLWLE
jgi:predicted regulator of Ras-like GTPase activity (Roadblock/LC7/MglB family)